MGKAIAPLLSNMAETFAEQASAVQDLLSDAERLLRQSEDVYNVIGDGMQLGMPFSQSSSTSVINGVSTSNIQASFPISGSYGQGVATLQGSQEYGISYLGVNVNGRTISVPLDGSGSGVGVGRTEVFGGSSSSSSSYSKNKSGFDKDDVIDVEFVDKKKY
mmetsp:Transcript_56435/g.83896  ORF Transcript_56435/g.83896 Transcript_56435/m.83896 type:complete len:161 (+) Transcript_56435:604-1086(+)